MNQNDVREAIGSYYAAHKELGKKHTLSHFQRQDIPRTTIYNIMMKVDKGQTLKRKPGSGRPKISLSPKTFDKLRRETVGKVAKGKRPLSQIVKVSPNTVSRILHDNNIIRLKLKTVPKTDPGQENRQKVRLQKLRRTLFQSRNQKSIVMDDESYFKFSDYHYSKHYYTDGQEVDTNVKHQKKEKFPKKLMIWIAVSEKGHSEPYFHESRAAVNADVYVNMILKKHLIPFIRKFHPNNDFIFWPDLASAHYAGVTLRWLQEMAIPFVPKELNPPAAPQIRPIELFWNHLKARVYADGWEAENTQQLKFRISEKLATFSDFYFCNLMSNLKTKVRKAADNGLISVK